MKVAKSKVISYWFPSVTGYKLLNLLVFTSGKEKKNIKLTALKQDKIKCHKC